MLKHGEYSLRIVEGGVEIHRGEALLYVNRRMLSVTVKNRNGGQCDSPGALHTGIGGG